MRAGVLCEASVQKLSLILVDISLIWTSVN
jgi:hypothetical protein